MTFHPESVAAVVFDMGGVFLYPDYEPVVALMKELGQPIPPPDSIDSTFRRAHHAGVRALLNAETEVREHDAAFWAIYDHTYVTEVGVDAALAEQFEVAVRVVWDWAHRPNIEAFHHLVASGMPTAIVSNNNGTAPEQLRRHGICQVLEGPLPRVSAIIDSSLVGVAKPDPAIMAPALYALGLPPERVLYVGDTVQADVAAATKAGMQVVQLDPFDHHEDHDHARMPDVAAIVAALGIG